MGKYLKFIAKNVRITNNTRASIWRTEEKNENTSHVLSHTIESNWRVFFRILAFFLWFYTFFFFSFRWHIHPLRYYPLFTVKKFGVNMKILWMRFYVAYSFCFMTCHSMFHTILLSLHLFTTAILEYTIFDIPFIPPILI